MAAGDLEDRRPLTELPWWTDRDIPADRVRGWKDPNPPAVVSTPEIRRCVVIDWSILTGGFDNSYGLRLFSELVANNSQWLPATPAAALPTGAVAHATKDAEGRLKVLLVAKDLEESAATATDTSKR